MDTSPNNSVDATNIEDGGSFIASGSSWSDNIDTRPFGTVASKVQRYNNNDIPEQAPSNRIGLPKSEGIICASKPSTSSSASPPCNEKGKENIAQNSSNNVNAFVKNKKIHPMEQFEKDRVDSAPTISYSLPSLMTRQFDSQPKFPPGRSVLGVNSMKSMDSMNHATRGHNLNNFHHDQDYATLGEESYETEDGLTIAYSEDYSQFYEEPKVEKVIAIGLPMQNDDKSETEGSESSQVDLQDAPRSRYKSEKEISEEKNSELVAKDVAKEEYDIKMQVKEAGLTEGVRRESAIISTKTGSSLRTSCISNCDNPMILDEIDSCPSEPPVPPPPPPPVSTGRAQQFGTPLSRCRHRTPRSRHNKRASGRNNSRHNRESPVQDYAALGGGRNNSRHDKQSPIQDYAALSGDSYEMDDVSIAYTEDFNEFYEEPEVGKVIAIGLPMQKEAQLKTPVNESSVDAQDTTGTHFKSESQMTDDADSELLAKDVAKLEHNLKMQAKQAGLTEGVRRQRTSCISSSNHSMILDEIEESPSEPPSEPPVPPPPPSPMITGYVSPWGTPMSKSHRRTPRSSIRNSKSSPIQDREIKMRAARGAMGAEGVGGMKRCSSSAYSLSSPPPLPPSSASKSNTDSGYRTSFATLESSSRSSTGIDGDENSECSLDEGGGKLPAVPSSPSRSVSNSNDSSGSDLDEKTLHRIQRSSHMRKRSSFFDSNHAAGRGSIQRTSQRSTSVISAASSHTENEFAEDSAHYPKQITKFAAAIPPGAINEIQKDDLRKNHGASTPGAFKVDKAPQQEEQKGLRMASAICSPSELVKNENAPIDQIRPNIDQCQTEIVQEPDRVEEQGQIEEQGQVLVAEAGVRLPGAFAVDGIGGAQPGYDSDVEIDDTPPLVDDVLRMDESEALQAELYEEALHVDALLVDETGPAVQEEQDKRKVRLLQRLSTILAAATVVISIVVAIVFSKKRNDSDLNAGIVAVEGWTEYGNPFNGPTHHSNINFGKSIAFSGDGNRLVIGLPGLKSEENELDAGSAYIYDFINGTDWIRGGVIEGTGAFAKTGSAVALSEDGKRVAVGSPGWEGGEVVVYEESGWDDWMMVGEALLTSDSILGVEFGSSLALSSNGRILAVGDVNAMGSEGGSNVGNVQIFQEVDSAWVQLGDNIEGQSDGDLFGWSLALSSNGMRVAASAVGRNEFTGSVVSYDYDDNINSWTPSGSSIAGETEREYSGSSVAMSGDGSILAVGAMQYSRGPLESRVGRVRIFKLENTKDEWEQLGQSLDGKNKFDTFGFSVALSDAGDILAVGSPTSGLFVEDGGIIEIMHFDGNSWSRIGSEIGIASDAGGERFGNSIALSSDGKRVAGGAPFYGYDGLQHAVGQVRVYQVADD